MPNAQGAPRRLPGNRAHSDEIDLGLFARATLLADDPVPSFTLPAVITLDPETKARNVGNVRMQVVDRRTTFLHWQVHKDAAASWREMEDRLEVGRDRARSGHHLRRHGAPSARNRRADAGRVAARSPGRARTGKTVQWTCRARPR